MERLHRPKLTTVFIVLAISAGGALTQSKNEIATNVKLVSGQLNIVKDKPVWMLMYFRQRYPPRIEIDVKGNTIEIP